eukprot:1980944-Rhodomonas_salina.1
MPNCVPKLILSMIAAVWGQEWAVLVACLRLSPRPFRSGSRRVRALGDGACAPKSTCAPDCGIRWPALTTCIMQIGL